jgi:NADH-quinone oxidoreductase subunit J
VSSAFGYLVYGAFALGAVALYFAMPRGERRAGRPAAILGTAAVAGLLILLATQAMAPNPYNVLFYLFAGLAVAAGAKVVSHPSPTYSAVYFGLVVLCVAVLLVMRMAEFLAVALVIIYAGAILVTYAFVLMLAQQTGVCQADVRAREPMAVIIITFAAMGALAGQLDRLPSPRQVDAPAALAAASDRPAEPPRQDELVELAEGNTRLVGERLFCKYVVVVQVGGLLLLIAMVGAIAMARKPVPAEDGSPPPPRPGDIGRRVRPF